MTKVKVGKEDSSSVEFVERRRAALERYLQRVVNHPSLLQDPDVRDFLEKEELPRAVGTQTLSGAGFLKMINRATEAVNKMTIKMNESDIWFEEKLQEVESEEQQLRKLHVVVETLVNHRKELSSNTAIFAKSVAMLGSAEDNTALSRALSQLAELEDKIEHLYQEQAGNDFFILGELLSDYIRLLSAVRGSFDQRMKTWQRWQDAQNILQKKREMKPNYYGPTNLTNCSRQKMRLQSGTQKYHSTRETLKGFQPLFVKKFLDLRKRRTKILRVNL
uniref:Sorting nexin 1 n=1 Tax=Erpetoichthys calabaricus TaxID=27687 RepID=A0A8C4SZ62_ERPCA